MSKDVCGGALGVEFLKLLSVSNSGHLEHVSDYTNSETGEYWVLFNIFGILSFL